MRLVYAAALSVILTVPALAQTSASQKDVCETDARRFCKDAIPDDAKIAACLKANQAKLSVACRKSYAARTKSNGM